MPNTPKLRGAILLDQLEYVEQAYGRAVIDRARATLAPALREEVEVVLPISWLSIDAVTALKNAIASELEIEATAFNRQVVRESMGKTISKLWRVLLRQLSDKAIIKRTPILYSKTFDRGEMSLEFSGKHAATFVLVGWSQIPEYDCAGLAMGIASVLQYAGRSDATVSWRKAGPKVFFDARWGRGPS